ncbi:inner nuclear membrane protein Man1 [Corythoichthys intestinalis]|uniref:inner nuclear membrane protein Man1 n=1 Tax=Corythoichthys intestinalis TaxID=161448 RepID=UPI0025A5418A|nr:inner nuclear membrane protein Man1 [Corythoichthys intestinalis]XP_061809556.1 inner nuclear membrane protein Man1-like [Nerophis lumbriciformis]
MASTQLTDEELYSELKRLGFTPGPVTEYTRPVYLKKLKKLREEHQQGVRSAKTRSGAAVNSGGGNTAGARPSSHNVTHLSSSRRPGRKSTVLGFSSDESDAEAPLKRKALNHSDEAPWRSPALKIKLDKEKSRHGAGSPLNSNNSTLAPGGNRRASSGWGFAVKSSLEADGRDYDESEDECEEKSSRSLNGSRASHLKTRKLAGNYSDSDEEEEEEVWGPGGDRSRGSLEPRRGHAKAAFLAPNPPGSPNMMDRRKEEEAGDGAKRKPIYVSLSENHRGEADKNNHADGEDTSRFSIGLRPRFSSYSSLSHTYRGNHSNHTAPNHSYSKPMKEKLSAAPEDELFQQFKREEVATSSSFSAHYLSMFLLTAACLFFLLLGLMYVRMRGTGTSEVDRVIKSHPFGSAFEATHNKTVRDLILKLLLNLHDHLAHIAGQHDCGDQQYPNRSLSIDEVSEYLTAQNEKFGDLIYTSLEWIIRTGQDVGIRLTGRVADEPMTDISEIARLESTHPRMAFTCRFRRAFLTVISRVLLVAVAAGGVWGLVCYVKYRWKREEEETRQMYHMVERIIDVLRSHNEACQENQDLQPYLPIPHVRDSLVQPQDRKKLQKIWERAVKFLSANESRIRTESQKIGGSDFLVWRWIQPSLSCDKSSLIPSKVWQGKAFPLDRRNSPPNSLTPCLKIRNMFDPVMEVGENWDLAIHEAILEKCSDNNGIVHITVDKNSREGCVYVKCLSAEHSGKAFKALHGSWFDGKLVTVKYLRLDRYHQRFPQAQFCSTPLKASSLHVNVTNTTASSQNHGSANSSGFS